MAEKVIHEVRIIEMDDGFRIEIRGDKEQIKEYLGRMRGMGFGPWMHHGPGGHGPFRHGPFGHGPFHGGPFRRGGRWGFGFGPWEEDESEEQSGKRPADAV